MGYGEPAQNDDDCERKFPHNSLPVESLDYAPGDRGWATSTSPTMGDRSDAAQNEDFPAEAVEHFRSSHWKIQDRCFYRRGRLNVDPAAIINSAHLHFPELRTTRGEIVFVGRRRRPVPGVQAFPAGSGGGALYSAAVQC
jgi:hypothetical protein